jgi:ubiquinone biosynthesis monooxygenase Coq6
MEEIAWREESHDISKHSAYSSFPPDSTSAGIPPEDSDLLPPLVTSIEPGTVASFPLRFNHTDAYVGEGAGSRTVLVGDAAHTIHPLAGQGLNMGLGDVESLARYIQQTVLQGGDIGQSNPPSLVHSELMLRCNSQALTLHSHRMPKSGTLKTTN